MEVLSAVVEALFDRLLEFGLKYFEFDLKEEVESLKGTLDTMISVVENAEKKPNEGAVKNWLSGVRKLVFLANDLLDEAVYEDMRRQQVHHFEKVRNSIFNLKRITCEKNIFERITKIRKSLEKSLVESSHLLHSLVPSRELNAHHPPETNSFGDTSNIIGRKADADMILKFLLPNNFSIDNVDFIDIWGNPGVGKTALAQVVFNDKKLAYHFDVKMWVHASYQNNDDPTNLKALMKATIESITGTSYHLPNTLDTIQQQLRKQLEQKKFLLVLDAMFNDRPSFLYELKNVLMNVGASGSKVLITTRTRNIHKQLDTIHSHDLKTLSDLHCKEVIRKYAFRNRNPLAYPELDTIVDKIVSKCSGFPLAAKKYGLLLMAESNRDRWELILSREVGEVIRENYDIAQTLPSSVKRCFAYTCVFPPKFKFDKEQLVQQWLALDFVPTQERGREYFDLMFSWSLFQYFQYEHTKALQTYVMDDDIRYIAISVAGEECFIMNQHNSSMMSELARHASVYLSPSESRRTTFECPPKSKGLYSLVLLARIQIPENFVQVLQCLRLLDLSSTDLLALPDSIGDLIHLRYLALNNTNIKCLPNSLCKLYHLQSLGLRNCYDLIELPKDIIYLTNLRHLDLHLDNDPGNVGRLSSMPQGIGKLTYLHTLSRFLVSRNNRHAGISELKDMNELRGSLLISSLDSVFNVEEARNANLVCKKHLQNLELRWCVDTLSLINDKGVIDHLKPHSNLRDLREGGYRGDKLSSWIGDPSLSCLETIKLYHCNNLEELPPLGQLPTLKKLELEKLPNLQSWRNRENEKFTSLHELVIRHCTNIEALHPNLPALRKLVIDECPNLTQLPNFPLLHSLKLKNSGELLCNSLYCLPSLSSLFLSKMLASKPAVLELRDCTKLQKLEISDCRELNFLPDYCLPDTLSYLSIEKCPSLQALPSGVQYLRNLTKLQIQNCEALQSLPMGMKGLNSLKSVELSCCPNLSSMWSDGFPDGLQILRIDNCHNFNECIYQHWDIISVVRTVQIDGDLIVSNEPRDSQASTSQNI